MEAPTHGGREQQDNAPAPAAQPAYTVAKCAHDRWWEVRDPTGELGCGSVYKRGGVEVVRGSPRKPRPPRFQQPWRSVPRLRRRLRPTTPRVSA